MVNFLWRNKRCVSAFVVASLHVSSSLLMASSLPAAQAATPLPGSAYNGGLFSDPMTQNGTAYRSFRVLRDMILKGSVLRELDDARLAREALLSDLFATKTNSPEASDKKKLYGIPALPTASSTSMMAYYLKVFDELDAEHLAKNPSAAYSPIANRGAFTDAEMFSDRNDNILESVVGHIDYTKTMAGKVILRNMILKPTNDVKELMERQNIIRELATKDELYNIVGACLEIIQKHEHVIAEIGENANLIEKLTTFTDQHFYASLLANIMSTTSELKKDAGMMNTFRFLGNALRTLTIGGSGTSLMLTIGGIITTILAAIGAIVAMTKQDFVVSASTCGVTAALAVIITFISCILFVVSLSPILRMSDNHNKAHAVFKQLLGLTHDYSMFVKALDRAGKQLGGNEYLSKYFTVNKVVEEVFGTSKGAEISEQLGQPTFEDPSVGTVFLDQGNLVSATTRLLDFNSVMGRVMSVVGLLDAYYSAATWFRVRKAALSKANERVAKTYGDACFAKYVTDSPVPFVKMNGGWATKINPDGRAIKNDAVVGKGVGCPFSLWTGANASGKSTYLKTVLANIILAQSLTMCASDSFEFTPFASIVSIMNTKDDTGQASLYQSELDNYKDLARKLASMPKGSFTFLVMDEAFRSTDHNAGAIILSGLLGSWVKNYSDNLIALCSTHLQEVSIIEDCTKGEVQNWKFIAQEAGLDQRGNQLYLYPYKAVKGCMSYDESIAINMLKKEGFDQSIIDFGKQVVDAYYEKIRKAPTAGQTKQQVVFAENQTQQVVQKAAVSQA